MAIYLCSLPIWNGILPLYAYWKFDDFSWGDTRRTAGETRKGGAHGEAEGEFDSSRITMKRWVDFEQERRLRGPMYEEERRDGRQRESRPVVGAPPPSAWTGRYSQAYRDSYHD